MKVRLLAPAEFELDEAMQWYAAQAPGLDRQFLSEVERAISRISEHPDAWHTLGGQIRRYRLSRFPYGIIYAAEPDGIIVLAIAHLHRKPAYWRRRR